MESPVNVLSLARFRTKLMSNRIRSLSYFHFNRTLQKNLRITSKD